MKKFANQFEELGYFSDQIKLINNGALRKEDKVKMLEALISQAGDPLARKMLRNELERTCN